MDNEDKQQRQWERQRLREKTIKKTAIESEKSIFQFTAHICVCVAYARDMACGVWTIWLQSSEISVKWIKKNVCRLSG